MRLVRLRVRNIASLKGEHDIDFGEIERQSPLFAITGETGSGKSSLLNSISLALYGQIYKKNVNQIDVVTLGEKEGFIELIFQVKGKYYLADWRVRVLKQNGEPYSTPQTPSRNLYTLEGKDFSSPKLIATVTAAELLNLDFDQFTKCIILNQGEFARFLTSSFTDRKEILEKLYPGELLESMGRELKLELDTLQKAKEGLEIELQTLKGDGTSGDILKEQKLSFEKEVTGLEVISKRIEELDYHFVSLASNHEKYAENTRRINTIKKDMSEHTTRFNLLLKKGQDILEIKEKTQKEVETRLPGLQLLLKKEESLKNAQESLKDQIAKHSSLRFLIQKLSADLETVHKGLSEAQTKLDTSKKDFTLPLEELRDRRGFFDEIFDLFTDKELLEEEIKGRKERLQTLETQGKELKKELETLEDQINISPEDLKNQEKALETQKKELHQKIEKHQRTQVLLSEVQKSSELLLKDEEEAKQRTKTLHNLISQVRVDLSPIETTLKLQEVLGAAEICVTHALDKNESECPVCHQEVQASRWGELKKSLSETNLPALKKKSDELNLLLVKSSEEEKLLHSRLLSLKEALAEKSETKKEFEIQLEEKLPTLDDLEEKLALLKKQVWELDSRLKEVTKIKMELHKAREQYSTLKTETTSREEKILAYHTKLTSLSEKLSPLVKEFTKESVALLKREARILTQYLEAEAIHHKISQNKEHLEFQKKDRETELSQLEALLKTTEVNIEGMKTDLEKELKGEKAGDLIQSLNLAAKNALSAWNEQEQEQKKQELQLKEFQSRLYELDKLTKDYDLQFTKEFHAVRELGHFSDFNRSETKQLFTTMANLALELTGPAELFIPLKDLLRTEKEFYKNSLNDARTHLGTVKARLEDWEKLQDKILLTQLKTKDVTDKFERRARLYEVLGKDELRTFVLSLVEENLIEQTNRELQKLCQGRYEILHQSRRMKMTPEFFILDKFREGGMRKISTLSGGETFMVSLAMALGLAEMTRGQAEIDSLFIDEGFGTLDQESLEDVLDMLQQIQTRGLMVGIISHIKALTSAIPVNLVLNKKNDGTSSVMIRSN